MLKATATGNAGIHARFTQKRFAIIDADGILYSAALGGQTECDGKAIQMLPIQKVYHNCVKRLEDAMHTALCEDAIICLSDRRNFRYDILPSYKSNRKATQRPILLDALRNMLVEMAPWPTMLIEGLEADDVCGISAGTLQRAGRHTVIVSPDKDLLTIPGEVCTPHLKDIVFTDVTRKLADRRHMMQTMTGDTVDGYKGCPGVGPRKAGLLLDMCEEEELTPAETWGEIIKLFEDHGLTKEDCLVQARVARILRVEDWDAVRKEPILFTFPEEDPAMEQREAA